METASPTPGQAPAQPPKPQPQYVVEGIGFRREFSIAMDMLTFLAGYCGGHYEPVKLTGSARTGFLLEVM